MALVVEDGTGLAAADAYLSVAEVETYVARVMRGDTAWSGATLDEREQAVREGTQLLDVLYVSRWRGKRRLDAQALAWPRTGARDDDAFLIVSTSVPQRVKDACAEMAWRAITVGGVDTSSGDSSKLLADVGAGGNIASESVQVGSIKSSTVYLGGKDSRKSFGKVDLLLVAHIRPAGEVSRA